MKTWLPMLVVLPLAAAAPARAARLEIILDVSGSMRAQVGGETRMDAARKAIRATVQGIEPDSVVALRLYGHRVSQDDKAGSCRDSELVVPFKVLDRASFTAIVDGATPRGQTPLTYSLEQAAQDFGAASDEERVIILVSDGAESCGGDPSGAMRKLQAQGFKVKVHTIGLDVDAAARAQLEAISNATGGEYHDARNAAALADSLKRLAQQSLLVAKGDDPLGQPVRGGDGYETAVRIEPGKLYRLDHHQRKGDYDYFWLEAREGQKVTASVETPTRGIIISGDSFREWDNAAAGLILQDSAREKLGEKTVLSKAAREEVDGYVPAGHGGRLYVLVGNTVWDQHKDGRFRVALSDRPGDAGTSADAGSTEADALSVAPGSYKSRLDRSDKIDFYKFKADPAATYRVRVRHSARVTNVDVSVASADGDVTKSSLATDGSPATLDGIKVPRGGDVFIEIKYQLQLGPDETPYTLDLTQDGGSTPTAAAAVATTEPAAPGGPSLIGRLVSFVLWSVVPLVVGLLVGGVGGYLFGRRARR